MQKVGGVDQVSGGLREKNQHLECRYFRRKNDTGGILIKGLWSKDKALGRGDQPLLSLALRTIRVALPPVR